jgi:CheY-like chemotaxis protein
LFSTTGKTNNRMDTNDDLNYLKDKYSNFMLATETDTYTAIRFNTVKKDEAAFNIKNILLAEDDDDDFDLFNSAILSINSSIEILRTKNGVMCTSLLETSIKPDIIILDLNMPFKNGISCLQEIKNKPQFNSSKVIIYSTSGHKREIDMCYNYGADFYLVKPTGYSCIIQQFKDLFSSEYFIKNIRPPHDKFVFDSRLQG